MEAFPRKLISLEQISLNNILGCEMDVKTLERAVGHQSVTSPREVICPEPRRASRAPLVVDSLNRLCCKPKSNYTTHRGDPSLDIFNIILNKDDPEDDFDTGNGQMSFFCSSPPVRTNNPLIHDVQFLQQTSTHVSSSSSPSGDSYGGKASSMARVERVPSCGTSSSFGGKPMVRIEGFSCGSSKARRIVSALA